MSTQVTWWDPVEDRPVHRSLDGAVDVADFVNDVRRLWAGHAHGNPSLVFKRGDESCLSIATDGAVAFLVWMNTLYESFDSVGGTDEGGKPRVRLLRFLQ